MVKRDGVDGTDLGDVILIDLTGRGKRICQISIQHHVGSS